MISQGASHTNDTTQSRIRHIFLSPHPRFPLNTVAALLEMPLAELKKEIDDGAIVAVSTGMGVRVTHEEMVSAAVPSVAIALRL